MPVSVAVCGPPGVVYSGLSANCSESRKVWELQGDLYLLVGLDCVVRLRMVHAVVYALFSVIACSVLGNSSF